MERERGAVEKECTWREGTERKEAMERGRATRGGEGHCCVGERGSQGKGVEIEAPEREREVRNPKYRIYTCDHLGK